MKNRVQRQLIYRVMWNDEVLSANIVPLSVTRHLSIWQFSHDSWRGASLQGRSIGANNTMLTLSTLIGRNTDAIRGLIHRNMGRGLIGWFIKTSHAVLFHCKPSTVRQIGHFCSRLRFLMSTQGEKGTTLYLKSCQVLLQQSIAGYKVSDLAELKVRAKRTKAGMPRIIPSGVRRRIREGDVQSLQLWMTLLGTYRILKFRGKLNLSTITDPGKRLKDDYLQGWISFLDKIFFPTLQKVFTPQEKVELPQPQPFPILKSGPTTIEEQITSQRTVSTSFYSLVKAAKLWQGTTLKGTLKELLVLWSRHNLGGQFPPIMERIGWAASCHWHYYNRTHTPSGAPISSSFTAKEGPAEDLAKLGFKEEAAGKVRVFAMVDAFTQWVMRPIHQAIFSILRGIPMDGTFNQTKPVDELRKYPVKQDSFFYSIDLSAATDRLPLKLQVPVMEQVFKWASFPEPARAAQLWAKLLVDRYYSVVLPPEKDRNFEVSADTPKAVIYSVGQPMGALSSWAMLALTHHAIVHWAAHRARAKYPKATIPIAFRNYAVLGDDIVIANKYVAHEYLRILEEIGVKAGLAKSIVSKGQFYVEFAKKFFVPSGRADMLPLKEVIATLSSTLLTCEFVKQHRLSIGSILTVLGYGYKAKSRAYNALYINLNRRLRTLLIWFRSPKGCFPVSTERWVHSSGFTSYYDVAEDHVAYQYIWEILMTKVQVLMNRYYDAAEKFRDAANKAGALRPDEDMTGPRIPISRHPPYLTERTEVDPGTNSVFKSRLSFKHLISPIDWEVHDETKGGEGLNWFLRLNLNYSHLSKSVDREPVVILPDSLIKGDLFEQVFAINDESLVGKTYRDKVIELTDWIMDFDKLAQDIPTSYWPQLRAGEKQMREFIECAKIHEIFSSVFRAFGVSPRSKPDQVLVNSGNTPFADSNIVLSKSLELSVWLRDLSLVPVEGTWNAHSALLHSGLDALSVFWRKFIVKQIDFNSDFFTSYSPRASNLKLVAWFRIIGSYIRDFIILASLVYLVPLYEAPVEEISIPLSQVVLTLSLGTILALMVFSWYLWVSYADFELSAIDLLSRQAQSISETEFRLMRMHAERLDLEDIIEGLESTIEILSSA